MLSFDELQKKYKDKKPQTVAGPSTEDPLYIKYREAVEAEKPKVAGGTVNPIISFGNVRENPVLKRKTNTTKTYSQALTESRNKAKVLENGAKLPEVIPPKGDVSKLILPDTGGGGTVNPTLKRNEVRTNYDYMTDREAAVYKYYRDRGQVEKAQEYLDALEMDVNQRAAMQKREDAKKLAEESTAAALYARAVGNIGQAAGAVYAAAMEGADKPVDPYHPLMGGVNMNEGLAEGLMGDSTGAEKFAKEAGLAVFDWGTQAATLGPLTPYVMAAGAAAGNTKEALERGGTTDEAVMYGLAGGAAEAITEKLGYDRLFELGKITKSKGAVSTFLKSLLPQAASEGAEEATSEIANILADTLIMGDNSQMKQIAQTAMENGATESEAVKTALMEGIKQVGYSGAVGAASGGVIAGGIGGLSRMTGRNTLEMAGNPVETARDAMTNAGNEVTQRTMKSRTRSEVPEGTQPEMMLKEQGNVLPERENMLPEQENVMVNRENVQEVTQQNKALRDFGEKYYYTEGQKLVNEEAERRGDTSFIPAFQTYYTAGLTGVKESDIKQTAETIVADKGLLRAAYLAGVNDRKEDLEARMKGTGKMGQTAGVFLETDAVTKEQRSLAELVSRVAELEVVLVDELPQDRRGYYENNKGRVTIALNSGQFAGTLFHEATHYIREANPEGYDRLRNAVFSAAAAMKGMDLESYTKKYEKMYGEAYKEAGQEVDYDMILEEMTADAFAEIAGDEKSLRAFVMEMQQTNPSVLEKIKEFLDNLLETLKGLVNDGRFSSFGGEIRKDIKTTEKFAKMLAEEMERAGEKQREEKKERKPVSLDSQEEKNKDVKYSKKMGGYFPDIEVSTEDIEVFGIEKLTNVGEVVKKVYDYLSEKYISTEKQPKPITNIDTGMEIYIYKGGINETLGKAEAYQNLSIYEKKVKLATMESLAKLIKYGEVRQAEAANYHNAQSTTTFAYLIAPIIVDGKKYHVEMDIKRTERGDRFYIHKIKVASGSPRSDKSRTKLNIKPLATTENIPQTERKGNVNTEKTEKRFSFAGERARTADREKLDMAKKMEEEGKTRREIYDKTGWFRGADDKWRFEIDDSQMQYRYAGVPGLSAYLQNTKLFEAYPELRDVTIKFEKLEDGIKGIYNEKENEITLDESLKEEPGTVLLHEIQHAIQRIEGHANGANREYWERRIEEGFDARTAEEKAKEWNLTKQMEELKRKNPEFYQDMQELDSMVPTVPRGRIDWETLEEIEPDPIEWQLYDQRREQLEEKYGVEMVWDYTDLKYELDQSRKGSGRTAFDLYYATAGEIEARDTEKRVHFTKEDRKKWFPNIGDEDTVFAEGVKFSLKEPIEETEDLIAVHNLTSEKFRRLLHLQGIPMPSIAITKSDATAEDFGEISLVFRKDTIDPADERNKVYDADAWTPMFPMLDKEEYGKTRAFLEELVRTMQAQTKSGKNAQGFMGENTMRAAMANRFVSLGEIKEAREKLEHLPKEEFEALREEMNQRLFGVLEEIYDTGSQTGINEVYEMEDIGEQIQNMAEEAKGVPSAQQIQQNLKKAGYPISMELAEQTARVLEEIKEMPTDFFEAKPERVVEFAEVAAAVVPDDLEADLRKAVENKIPQVLEYEAGSKESRVRQLNRVEGVRFSIREEEYEDLVEKNEALQEANEALRRQFEITKDAVHDPVSAKKAVRKWLKAHDSEYDVDDFTEKFLALADYVANAGDQVDMQMVMAALQKLAYDALSESKVLNTDLSDAYKDFKDDVRKTKIKVTEDMAEEFDYYGGYNTVRKENFGKINLSRQGGIYADVFYQELAEKYPGLLDVERISTQVDAVMDILEVVESLQPIYENPYGMNLDEYAMDAAYDLFNMYFDIEMQKPTFADKYEKKIEQMKVENQKMKAAQEKMRNDLKEKYHNRMVDIRRRGEKKLAEEKERSIKRIDQVLREKDRLQRRLETQWEAHRNSMQQADQRELARLMSEGRKTAAKMRKLKEKGDQYKEKLDQMMEEEQEWISAYEELMKEKKAEYRQNLKDLEQRMKEEQRRKLDDARLAAAMHEGRALLEQRRAIYEKLKERDKERRDRAEYAKYKNIIEKEAALLKRWVERPTDQYHVQESMMEGVRNFLEKMKFDDPDLNIMPTDIRRMMKDYQAMTAENTMLYAEEDENVQAMLESLADRVGDGVKVSELGPTEMRQLSVVIRSVSHLVRNANKMVSIKNGEKISTIGNAYMDDVQNKKTKNPDSRLRVLSDMMNVQMLDTESFFKEMGKTVHDTIYRGLREGFDRKILHVKEASEFMQKTVDKKKIREWGEMEPKEYTLSGGKISLTDAQIMSLYCLMRRTQARGHIFGGGIKGEPVVHKVRGQRKIVKNTEPVEVTAADVTKLMSNLTEEQKKAALEIQGYLESVASWGNEVTMNMLGYKKFTETNYFPIVTDENYINTMYGARGEKNSTLQTMGITKQTNREAKNPIILENIFDAYVRHIDQMSSYNAFVPALSDLNKFMNYREMVRVVDGKKFGENRSVKETMQRVMGPAGDKYVRDLMERLNNPAVKEDVERLPRIFLRNMKIASVGANLRVIIQQPVSYLRAADEIGVGYLMGALVPSKTDFQKVYEYAPIAQWKEWGNYEMNVGRTMKELLIGQNIYESFLEKSMIVAGVMDKLTWGRIWRAAELEVKKKHPELTGNRYYETVGKRFSEIIDGTQVVDSILHRNQMMRSQSLFSQMATSFMSEPTKTYNMMRNSMVAVIKDNTPENRKKVVRTFMTLVANGVCVAAVAGLVDMLRDDDDDETLLEKWLQAFRGDFTEAESVSDYILAAISSNLGNSFNPLGYIPYMRDIFSVIQGYTVQRTDISWLNDLVKSGKNLMRYMSGESNYTLNAVLMDAAGSLSKATGIPINSAKRDIMAIKNTIVNYTLGLDAQYENQKLTYDVGSEKNINMYVKMMLEAKMSGNEQIATRIYNDMVNGGISNEKIDNKIKTEQVKAIKEEPEAMEAAKAYNEGRVDDYTRNVEALAKKGYFMANIESAVESLTKPPTEDEETFETITKDYWKEEGEVESADYALLFNAYMNGNMADYEKMWSILNAAGKEDNGIRSSMRSRLKSEYWKAKEAGDSQRMQRSAEEFYRLGGKRETLEKPPK